MYVTCEWAQKKFMVNPKEVILIFGEKNCFIQYLNETKGQDIAVQVKNF